MQLGTYSIVIEFSEPGMLPVFKGSALRGSFGRSLKQVCCALKRQECESCMLRSQCVYAQTFEFQKSSQGPAKPHPYVLQPPDDPRQEFSPGEQLEFSLSLFGLSNQHLPYFVYAMEQMGRYGLGKNTDSGRGRFFVKDVSHAGHSIYSREEQILNIPDELPELILSDPPPASYGELQIILHTPLRLKHQNKLARELPFGLFIRAVLRRLSSVTEHFGAEEIELPYRDLIHKADTIPTHNEQLRWHDIPRYSSRQQTSMLLGGLVGTTTYSGDIAGYVPLVQAASKLNIGKQTAFGLGNFSWEWNAV
jgi:hypothetical protein